MDRVEGERVRGRKIAGGRSECPEDKTNILDYSGG